MNKTTLERVVGAAKALREAEKPVRVLRTIGWPEEVRSAFFASGEKELPSVTYDSIDTAPVIAALTDVRKRIDGPPSVRAWLTGIADVVESGAKMLGAIGSPGFTIHSRDLYGAPSDPLLDGMSTPLELAETLAETFSQVDDDELGSPEVSANSADTLAAFLREHVVAMFADDAPAVEIVDELSANVIAGRRRIRVRRGAKFSDRDLEQLLHHEVEVHVATSLNGRSQKDLPILAAAHPGTTRTQEGLAVFAEFITGALDPDRFRRLAQRVLAIQMAIDGADFIQVYEFFREQGVEREQAFENARRVFRGGVITGGAPFTKDAVYLDGLIRVHNFLRAVVANHRTDCLQLLFCGKLDIEDLPALCELASAGVCRLPTHLPPWASDRRFLIAYLAYSGFLNRVELGPVRDHYADLMADAPVLEL